MPLLGSLITHLILAVTLVLAAAVAGIMAYHYAKARLREKRGYAFDPAAEEAVQPGSVEQRAKSAEEITEIRSRIEALMERQQIRSETENQHLAQKLDEIRTHMSTQDRKFDGLKSELRHEIHRRDGELDELRDQLASALDAFWKSMPALPEEGAAPRALPLAQATAAEVPPLEVPPTAASALPAPPVAEPSVAESPVETAAEDARRHAAPPTPSTPAEPLPQWSHLHDEISLDEVPLEDVPTETPQQLATTDPEPVESDTYVVYEDTSPAEEATFVEVPFEEEPQAETLFEEMLSEAVPEHKALSEAPPPTGRPVESAAPSPPAGAPRETPAPPPTSTPRQSAPLSWSTPFAGGDGAATGDGVPSGPPPASHAPAPPADEAPAAPPLASAQPAPPVATAASDAAAPIEGDDLTVISSITPEIQRALYAAGVTSLEGIARWSRADARRASSVVGVPEEIVMHQWIFEAQSVLFEQYQTLMTQEA